MWQDETIIIKCTGRTFCLQQAADNTAVASGPVFIFLVLYDCAPLILDFEPSI